MLLDDKGKEKKRRILIIIRQNDDAECCDAMREKKREREIETGRASVLRRVSDRCQRTLPRTNPCD